MASLIETDPVVLEKKIFKFCQCMFANLLLSPLGKGRGPSFEQTWIPISQECFVFGWNWPSGSEEEDENMKSLRQQRRRRRTNCDEKSSLESLALVFSYYFSVCFGSMITGFINVTLYMSRFIVEFALQRRVEGGIFLE